MINYRIMWSEDEQFEYERPYHSYSMLLNVRSFTRGSVMKNTSSKEKNNLNKYIYFICYCYINSMNN